MQQLPSPFGLKNQVPGNAQMQIVILKDLDGYTCSNVDPAPPENAQLRWQSHQKVRLTHLWMAQRLGRQGSPQFGDGALARKEFHYSHFNPDMWKKYGISIQNIWKEDGHMKTFGQNLEGML